MKINCCSSVLNITEPANGAILTKTKMDRKIKPLPPDTRSVDIEDTYAVAYWAKEFNVSAKQLKEAVRIAGINAPDVKRELKK